jgi:photosystem II stability/assembly factor-like uncharacterized protein
MKKIKYLLIVFVTFYSCEQYPEPGSQTIETFNYKIIGDLQSAEAGDYLPKEVGAQIYMESLFPKTNKKFHLEIEVISGNGSVDNLKVESDNQGKMLTRWKLGNETNEQQIKAKIFDSTGRFYSEFEIEANAFFMDKWNTITSGFLIGIGDMVKDTITNRSMMISGSNLYVKEGADDKFYEWEQIQNYNFRFKNIEINSKGEVFGGGWNGNLYKSVDWGKTWSFVSKPIPENPYNFELSISKDDFIWVSRWDKNMYCSTDNGHTWQKDTSIIAPNKPLGPVYQFNNSSHLALAQNIMQTFDGGVSWKVLNTPKYQSTLYITDKNDIILQNQEGGLYKSTDSGLTFNKVLTPHVAFGTTSWHCFDRYKNNYYVLAPGGGVWKTKDFEEFENLITFSVQRNLFIDHNGTIYASGYNYSNAVDDPTLVLPNNE